MADYYPLIAKAVSGLDKSTSEARRALYDRARTALLAQLRGVEPALSEPDITRERLALEEAIRKVEAEAVRRSRGALVPARQESHQESQEPHQESHQESRQEQDPHIEVATDQSEELPSPLPRYDLRASRPMIAASADDDGDPSDAEETRQAVPLSAAAARPTAEAHQVDEPRVRTPRVPSPSGEGLRLEGAQWSRSGPTLSEKGLKGFRNGIGESDSLESATPPYFPPHVGESRAGAFRSYQTTKRNDLERLEPPSGGRSEARGEPRMEQSSEQALPRRSSRDIPRPPSPTMRQDDGRGRLQSFPRVISAERAPERPPENPAASAWSMPRSSNRIVATVVLGLLILIIAGAAYWWGEDILTSIRGPSSPAQTADQVAPAEGSAKGKITERAPQAPSPTEGALLAQKVVLYEEDQANPNGTQFVGSAVWRTERVAPGPGQQPDVVVRAEIEIPEQKLQLRMSLRRNDDKQLPASHTVEIVFTLPPDFAHGGISNIPGILMKQGETTRGVPLNGVAVKVTTNFFLIGLSSVDADMQRNVQLLKERSWFDIPVVYGDGKRAIIAIEKGIPGERAFTEAFAAWGQ
jgi:hypothetical protein